MKLKIIFNLKYCFSNKEIVIKRIWLNLKGKEIEGLLWIFSGQYIDRGEGDRKEGENWVGIKPNRTIMHVPPREVRPVKMIGKY